MKAITSILSILALTATLNAAEGDKKPEGDAPKKPAAEAGKKAPPSPEAMMKALDKNTDGKVSKEEFMASPGAKKDEAKAAERFGKMDKDKDGSLTLEEMTPKKKKDAK